VKLTRGSRFEVYMKTYKCEVRVCVCVFVCSKKTVGELCEDMEVVRCTDAAFGNREMTFKLNKASTFYFLHGSRI